jgi:hypothetical protein
MLFSNTLPWRWAGPVTPTSSSCVPARAVFRPAAPSGFSGRLGSHCEAQCCSVTTCPSFATLPCACAGSPQLQQAQEPMLSSPRMLAMQLFSTATAEAELSVGHNSVKQDGDEASYAAHPAISFHFNHFSTSHRHASHAWVLIQWDRHAFFFNTKGAQHHHIHA